MRIIKLTGKLEEEEAASSRKRCMTPLVCSILGFPEENGNAWVTYALEEEEVDESPISVIGSFMMDDGRK